MGDVIPFNSNNQELLSFLSKLEEHAQLNQIVSCVAAYYVPEEETWEIFWATDRQMGTIGMLESVKLDIYLHRGGVSVEG